MIAVIAAGLATWTVLAAGLGVVVGKSLRHVNETTTQPAPVTPEEFWLADQPCDCWPKDRIDAEVDAMEGDFRG